MRWLGRSRAAVGGCLAAATCGRYRHAEPGGSKSDLSEEASRAGRYRFSRSRSTTPTLTPTWTPPTRTIRSHSSVCDIGHARRVKCSLVESQIDVGGGFSPGVRATQVIIVVQRFGAAPGRDLVELRAASHARRRGSACGIPRGHYSTASTSGQSARESLEAICRDIGGRAVSSHRGASARTSSASSSSSIPRRSAGVDLLARSARRSAVSSGKEGGLSVDAARAAAGI